MSKPNISNEALLTQERLKSLLHYNPATGVFTWVAPLPRSKVQVGDKAGCLGQDGYLIIKIAGMIFRAHRLAWLYMTGAWPVAQIDHRNLIKSENWFDNLREATGQQNLQHRGPFNGASRSCKSGQSGVSWNSARQKWIATIRVDGKQTYLGGFDRVEDAAEVRRTAADKHFGEFARAA